MEFDASLFRIKDALKNLSDPYFSSCTTPCRYNIYYKNLEECDRKYEAKSITASITFDQVPAIK